MNAGYGDGGEVLNNTGGTGKVDKVRTKLCHQLLILFPDKTMFEFSFTGKYSHTYTNISVPPSVSYLLSCSNCKQPKIYLIIKAG